MKINDHKFNQNIALIEEKKMNVVKIINFLMQSWWSLKDNRQGLEVLRKQIEDNGGTQEAKSTVYL